MIDKFLRYFPLVFYYIFYLFDLYKTHKGILANASNEVNPLAKYLFKNVSRKFHLIVNILYPILITFLVFISPLLLSLWISYSVLVGHMIGFLSWTKLNIFRGRIKNTLLIFLFAAVSYTHLTLPTTPYV